MKTNLLLTAAFAMAMMPAAFAQSTHSPSSQDPTGQPSASPSQQTPSQTNPSTSTGMGSDSSSTGSQAQRNFTGSIVKTSGKYMLHTSGADYLLDDQSQAKKFDGKDVRVTGSLDSSSNTIKVQSIDPSSSM